MTPKDTIGRRETGSQAKGGDREEERLNDSQGYNRKERDRLSSKGEAELKRLALSQGYNRKERETGSLVKGGGRAEETHSFTRIQ
jgi:hypothetical protein